MMNDEPGMHPSYDYIIAGAGCAGLSLAMHLIRSGLADDKKILLIDRDRKQQNDRTWCFWERAPGIFEPIVYHGWPKLAFHGADASFGLDPSPYQYKMIRGIDFYRYCLNEIERHPNFTLRFEPIEHLFSSPDTTGIVVGAQTITAQYVFSSLPPKKPVLSEKEFWLLQHFRGWIIETETPAFDPQRATLMDFRMAQDEGTAFCYVLPFSNTRALVEYTLFSENLLAPEAYAQGLRHYIKNILNIEKYTVEEEEQGVIPMTNAAFAQQQNHIIYLGTAGGQTKGSSGYTFQFIQKHSQAIVAALSSGAPLVTGRDKRFSFYDSVLLHILHHRKLSGASIFTDLFRKNPTARVLKFLDNETSLAEDLRVIATLPTLPFMKAALRQIF